MAGVGAFFDHGREDASEGGVEDAGAVQGVKQGLGNGHGLADLVIRLEGKGAGLVGFGGRGFGGHGSVVLRVGLGIGAGQRLADGWQVQPGGANQVLKKFGVRLETQLLLQGAGVIENATGEADVDSGFHAHSMPILNGGVKRECERFR